MLNVALQSSVLLWFSYVIGFLKLQKLIQTPKNFGNCNDTYRTVGALYEYFSFVFYLKTGYDSFSVFEYDFLFLFYWK